MATGETKTPPPTRQSTRRGQKRIRKKLRVNETVRSGLYSYRILTILGSGGFGDVYKVMKIDDDKGQAYAMKTECNSMGKKNLERLKIESAVFTEIKQLKEQDKERGKHFIDMIDKGRTDSFKFIVMELVGYSIESIRKDVIKGPLKWSSVMKIAMQTLTAVREFHSLGYIHRDIKPHNFAAGAAANEGIVYMLDFGISRRFKEKDGRLKIPRAEVKFLGTVKFASRACHKGAEQSRRDDLESWCIMILDLFFLDNILWRHEWDRKRVAILKDSLFTKPEKKNLRCPSDVVDIVKYVNQLEFTDEPDYEYVMKCLRQGAKTEKIDIEEPFEWIGKTIEKPKKRKKKNEANRLQDDEMENTEERKTREQKRRARREEAHRPDMESSSGETDSSTTEKEKTTKKGPASRAGSVRRTASKRRNVSKRRKSKTVSGNSRVTIRRGENDLRSRERTRSIAPVRKGEE